MIRLFAEIEKWFRQMPKEGGNELAGPGHTGFMRGLEAFISGNPLALNIQGIEVKLRYPDYTSDYSANDKLYRLFEEMLMKDGHLSGLRNQRLAAVLSRDRQIMPASSEPKDQEIAEFVEWSLDSIKDWDGDLKGMLDAVGKGFSVMEVLWDERDGWIVPKELKHRWPGYFVFDREEKLKIVKSYNIKEGVPDFKFLVTQFGGDYNNPYGGGLIFKCVWYWWIKKNNIKFWAIFNEKFGGPTAVGKYRRGASQEERDRLMEVLKSIQQDTAVTIPEDMAVELLEAVRRGDVSSYKDLGDYCDDEMSKNWLGSTLAISEGRRSGSLALGEVHEGIRNEVIEPDAKMLDATVNQLIKWIVDINYGPQEAYPKHEVDIKQEEDLKQEVEIDRQLVSMGVGIPIEHFYDKYQRRKPEENERTLRYDNENLYQYHLKYGVLTINEVRATLGLPPVPWGSRPVSATLSKEEKPEAETAEGEKPEESLVEELEKPEFQESQRIESLHSKVKKKIAFKRYDEVIEGLVAGMVKEMAAPVQEHWGLVKLKINPPEADQKSKLTGVVKIDNPGLGRTITEKMISAYIMASALGIGSCFAEVREQGVDPDGLLEGAVRYFQEPDGAIEYLRSLKLMTQAEYEALVAELVKYGSTLEEARRLANEQALRFAAGATEEIMEFFEKQMERAVAEGITAAEFIEEMEAMMAETGLAPATESYLENVFRTNVMKAYNEERRRFYEDPTVSDAVWGYHWYNPDDERSRPGHAQLNGMRAPKSDPVWDALGEPPLDFRCRCKRHVIMNVERNKTKMVTSDWGDVEFDMIERFES